MTLVPSIYSESNGSERVFTNCNRQEDDEQCKTEVNRLIDSEDNVTEQTHHIIIPSYAAWFDYNRYLNPSFHVLQCCLEKCVEIMLVLNLFDLM